MRRSFAGRLALAASALMMGAAGLALAPSGASASAPRAVPHTGNSFPPAVWNVGVGHVGFGSPTVAEIDGVRAVVVGSESGWVYVMNAANGAELPGWPQRVQIAPGAATAVDSTPTVAYLDGPTRPPSIIVGAGSLNVPDQQGGLEVFYANGRERFVFHTRDTFNEWSGGAGGGYADAVFSTPAVGDITGNGQQDIVFGSYDHFIYALTPSGSLVPGFPYNNQDTIWSSPALFDASHAGKDDIYIGADSTGLDGCFGGWLYDLRYEAGAPRVVWSHCEPQTFWSSPAIGEIDHSGRAAVVIGTSWNTIYGRPATSDKIYAFYADNGAAVPGWPAATDGPTFGSPAIGDVLGNGQQQVVETSCAHCSNGPATVSVFTGAGQQVWSTELNSHEELGSPTLVDLTNSPDANDIIAGNTLGLYMLDGRNGVELFGTGNSPVGEPCSVMNQPAVSLVPGVGWRLFDACGGPVELGHVIAYPLPNVPRVAPAWPEFRGDADHTGVATTSAAPAHGTCARRTDPFGYRFVAADGGVFSFGNLGYCGSTGAVLVPGAVVGMATTPDKAGYWLATSNGSVYAFGDAYLYAGRGGLVPWGSMAGLPLPGPIVGITATVDGRGYYLVGADGSVYDFGDAVNYGGPVNRGLKSPIVGMALDTLTRGYWLVASDGGIFSYHAPFYGSTGALRLHSPIVGMTEDPTTGGYWFVAGDGGIFAFHARFFGSMGGHHLNKPIVGMADDPATGGYWLVASDGGIFAFHARFYGSTGSLRLNRPIDGMSA